MVSFNSLCSVYRYANDNIKNYFAKKSDNAQFGDISNTRTVAVIGTNLSSTELNLDMRKYSYYPIILTVESRYRTLKLHFIIRKLKVRKLQ